MRFAYVPVPEDRVPDVYRFLADLLARERFEADPALIGRVYRESDEAFRRLLDLLADHPDKPMTTAHVAKALNLPRGTGSLAGMLGAFGRRASNRYDGFWPFQKAYNPIEESNELVMPSSVARIIDRLRYFG